MKAVVVDIQGKHAVALNKNGSFIKIKNNQHVRVGCEVDIPDSSGVGWNKVTKMAATAAVFLFAAGIGFGAYAYNSPYSYINIDINPSVELTTNIFDRVIKVEALNEDGKKVLDVGEYNNLTVNKAVGVILDRAVKEGYLEEGISNAVMFTIASKDEDKGLHMEKELQRETESDLKEKKITSDIAIEKVELAKHDDARKAGISPGKIILIEKLSKLEPDVKVEELKKKSVKEIMKSIKDKKKEEGDKGEAETVKIKEDKKINQTPAGSTEQDSKGKKDEKTLSEKKDGEKQKANSGKNQPEGDNPKTREDNKQDKGAESSNNNPQVGTENRKAIEEKKDNLKKKLEDNEAKKKNGNKNEDKDKANGHSGGDNGKGGGKDKK